MSLFEHIFCRRIRELERELDRVGADLRAIQQGEFEKISVTQMTYTPETGLQCKFEANIAKVIAAWAFNTLEAVEAKNYVEFQVRHPKDGAILITVQRARGETPGAKAARLESELTALKASAP